MICYKCSRAPVENGLSMIPVDPKGTISRRWVCTECADKNEISSIPSDVKELCTIINPSFIEGE